MVPQNIRGLNLQSSFSIVYLFTLLSFLCSWWFILTLFSIISSLVFVLIFQKKKKFCCFPNCPCLFLLWSFIILLSLCALLFIVLVHSIWCLCFLTFNDRFIPLLPFAVIFSDFFLYYYSSTTSSWQWGVKNTTQSSSLRSNPIIFACF